MSDSLVEDSFSAFQAVYSKSTKCHLHVIFDSPKVRLLSETVDMKKCYIFSTMVFQNRHSISDERQLLFVFIMNNY